MSKYDALKYYYVFNQPYNTQIDENRFKTIVIKFKNKFLINLEYILCIEKKPSGDFFHLNVLVELKLSEDIFNHWKKFFRNDERRKFSTSSFYFKSIDDTIALLKYILKENECVLYVSSMYKDFVPFDKEEKTILFKNKYESDYLKYGQNYIKQRDLELRILNDSFNFEKESLKGFLAGDTNFIYHDKSYLMSVIDKLFKKLIISFNDTIYILLNNNKNDLLFEIVNSFFTTDLKYSDLLYIFLSNYVLTFKSIFKNRMNNDYIRHYDYSKLLQRILYKFSFQIFLKFSYNFSIVTFKEDVQDMVEKDFLKKYWGKILFYFSKNSKLKVDKFIENELYSFIVCIERYFLETARFYFKIEYSEEFLGRGLVFTDMFFSELNIDKLVWSSAFYIKKLPMLVTPVPWKEELSLMKNISGGYLYNYIFLKASACKVSDGNELNSNVVLNTLNYLQKVPYYISKDDFDFFNENIFKKLQLEKVDLKNNLKNLIALENKPNNYYAEFTRLRNRLMEIRVLEMDKTYLESILNYEKFYFPMRLDFRGRIICMTDISPTTSKLFLTMLRSYKKYTTNVDVFKYVIERSFKSDRRNYDFCLRNFDWLNHKDYKINFEKVCEPLEYYLCCQEYERYLVDNNYKSDLMISFDATSSGLQIMSLLSGDNKYFDSLNLSGNFSILNGFYGSLYNEVGILFFKKCLEDIYKFNFDIFDLGLYKDFSNFQRIDKTKPVCEILSVLFLDLLKSLFMKRVYGQTTFSFRQDAYKFFVDNQFRKNNNKYKNKINQFIKNLWQFSEDTGLFKLLKLFNSYGNLFTKKNSPIRFAYLHKGIYHHFQMYYYSVVQKRLQVLYKNNFIYHTYYTNIEFPKINSRRMSQSMLVNYVHMCDSLIIHLTVKNILLMLNDDQKNWLNFIDDNVPEKFIPLYTVHDCFLTPSYFVFDLRRIFLNTICEIFYKEEPESKYPLIFLFELFEIRLKDLYGDNFEKVIEPLRLEKDELLKDLQDLDLKHFHLYQMSNHFVF